MKRKKDEKKTGRKRGGKAEKIDGKSEVSEERNDCSFCEEGESREEMVVEADAKPKD